MEGVQKPAKEEREERRGGKKIVGEKKRRRGERRRREERGGERREKERERPACSQVSNVTRYSKADIVYPIDFKKHDSFIVRVYIFTARR